MKLKDDFADIGIIRKILSISDGIYLSGGAVRDNLIGHSPKDYDLFFRSNEDFLKSLEFLISNGARAIDSRFYTITFEYKSIVIQLVKKEYFDSPTDVYRDFDFINVMATVCIQNGEEKCFCHEHFKELNEDKILEINVVIHGFKTFERLIPYMRKGYDVDEAYDYLVSLFSSRSGDKKTLMLSSQY